MDVKGAFEEALEGGLSFDEASYQILAEFKDILTDPDDGPAFSLALAAVQVERGEIHDWVKRKALQTIDRRRGLAAWREAGRDAVALHEEARADLRRAILAANVKPDEIPKRLRQMGGVSSVSSTSQKVPEELQTALNAIDSIRNRPATEEQLGTIAPLLTGQDDNLRFSAAQVVFKSARANVPLPERVFSVIIGAMSSEDRALRERAAKAVFMLQLDLKRLWEPTVRLLSDPVPRVRAAAAMGIWQLRRVADASCLPPLITDLDDASSKVRENAAFALSFVAENGVLDQAASPHLISLLSASVPNERAGAAAALKEMAAKGAVDSAALPKLIELLEDKSDLVVSWASLAIREYAIRGICDARALPPLTRRLAVRHGESLVGVLKAAEALAEKGLADANALPLLEKLTRSTARSGHVEKLQGNWKHYTIGELAHPLLEKVKMIVEGRADNP